MTRVRLHLRVAIDLEWTGDGWDWMMSYDSLGSSQGWCRTRGQALRAAQQAAIEAEAREMAEDETPPAKMVDPDEIIT